MYVLLRVQLARIGPQFLSDLKYYVEHGNPSPRKQRQLRAAKRSRTMVQHPLNDRKR